MLHIYMRSLCRHVSVRELHIAVLSSFRAKVVSPCKSILCSIGHSGSDSQISKSLAVQSCFGTNNIFDTAITDIHMACLTNPVVAVNSQSSISACFHRLPRSRTILTWYSGFEHSRELSRNRGGTVTSVKMLNLVMLWLGPELDGRPRRSQNHCCTRHRCLEVLTTSTLPNMMAKVAFATC